MTNLERSLDQVDDEVFEFIARQLRIQVQRRAIGCRLNKWQADFGRFDFAKLAFCLFGRDFEPLHRHRIFAQVDAIFASKPQDQMFDDAIVEIFTAKERVARRRQDVEHALVDFQYRDVERTAAQVENGYRLRLLHLRAIGDGGGSRLVDDAQDVEPGDLSSIDRRLSLGVVKYAGTVIIASVHGSPK